MKKTTLLCVCTVASFLSLMAFADDETKVIQKLSGGSGDSSVLIETSKNAKLKQDYEIISGDEEVVGDPTAGTKEAYASWKEDCKEWKKELKENNKDGQVLIASCGSAKFTKDDTSGAGSGIYTYKSNGKYKVRVRIRDK